ncbi:hypothetical protein FBULB1_3981 [Fusarium bulbicola]|nr:hypothetical protein FBULB1_3981 [Fusarium bulbicola]
MPDEPSSSDRAGLLYAVFLRLSPDANANADLLPNALTSDDFASWQQEYLDRTNIEAQMIGQGSICVWKASLSRDQVSHAERLDGVKSVQPNLHNLDRRYVAGARLLKKEFRNVASQHLVTDLAVKNGDKPWFNDDDEGEDDEDMHPHGTCGAGKALGTQFGVSKKATLIVVRMHEVTSEEFEAALELIRTDLKDHPERRKKSVVTMSLTLGRDWDEDDNLKDFTKLFQYLFDIDSKDPVERAGTSYAAPQVAGEIANLLSYDIVPFDTSDGNLVKNLKAYLQSDAASWERYPGIRVLWDRYIEREEVKHLIEDEFCPDVSSSRDLRPQNSAISRMYNMDTPNKVTLSVSLIQGDSVSDFVKYLMMTVDDCYRVDNDPSDYKGGGQTVVGDATYEVYPGSLRSPSRYGKQAGCDSTYKFTFNEYWVWGHGWASSDHGEALKKEIKGCVLLPDTWKFTYSIGEDGLGKTSGIDDFGCAGSG